MIVQDNKITAENFPEVFRELTLISKDKRKEKKRKVKAVEDLLLRL